MFDTYERSYDSGRHWRPVSREEICATLSAYYKDPNEVLEQVDNGDVIQYRSLRVRRVEIELQD